MLEDGVVRHKQFTNGTGRAGAAKYFAGHLSVSQYYEKGAGLLQGEKFKYMGCSPQQNGPVSDFCRYCGAVNAIVKSQHATQQQVEECRIQCVLDGRAAAMDLRVWATPLLIGAEPFTVLAIRNTTDEKRRKALEQLFFHDTLNTAGGLSGLLEILPDLAQEEVAQTTREALFLAEQLIEEIQSHRDLAAAERGDLPVINATEILRQMATLYRHHSVAEGKTLIVREGTGAWNRAGGTAIGWEAARPSARKSDQERPRSLQERPNGQGVGSRRYHAEFRHP
jgi:hypothetical protein